MEGVERMNAIMVCPNQRVEFIPCNLYAIDVDRESWNCYNCERFGHLARNCRNRGTENRNGESRRLEYKNNKQRRMIEEENRQVNNLNEERDLIVLN